MKRKILWGINISVFLILFSSLFFYVLRGEYSATRICSYVFIVFSYICGPIFYFSTSSRDGSHEIYSYPKFFITFLLFVVSFITGMIFIFLNNESLLVPLAVEGSIIAVFIVAITLMLISEDANVQENLDSKANSRFRDECVMMSELIWRSIPPQDTDNLKLFSKIQNALKTLRVSEKPDSVSIDLEIREILEFIRNSVYRGDGIQEKNVKRLLSLCDERNHLVSVKYNS